MGTVGIPLDRAAFVTSLRAAFVATGCDYRIQAGAVDALYDAASFEINRLVEEASVAAEAEGSLDIDVRHVLLARRMLCM